MEPVFNEPYLSTSLQDFWSRRWNLMVPALLRPAVHIPLQRFTAPLLGLHPAFYAGVLATFLVSGLMHELIYFYIIRKSPTWEVTCFFLLHGVVTSAEIAIKNMRWLPPPHRVVSSLVVAAFMLVTAVWLFFPVLRNDVHQKANFEALLGKHSVMVDLNGLGKGEAWINGQSIGRYWPSFNSSVDGCKNECDYRGKYGSDKCALMCGKQPQRWYHVPRSFLNANRQNTILLFEEMGSKPSMVNFKKVVIGTTCPKTNENNKVKFSCHDRLISAVKFASFGNPAGCYGSFMIGTCQANNDAVKIVSEMCVGKNSCNINVSSDVFGSTLNCGDSPKKLAVELECSTSN